MLSENLQDAADILSNIFNQSLDIPGVTLNVSLLGAALNFDTIAPADSDLYKIVQELAKYPASTQTLIQELHLLTQDLESSLFS